MPDILVKQDATLTDTVNLIARVIRENAQTQFVRNIAQQLNVPGCPECFFKRLHSYVYNNVKYKLDPEGRERVYKPQTTLTNGTGDCKKMTAIIASVLSAAGYRPLLKHVYFNNAAHTHIYVILPTATGKGYYTFDPVESPVFNQECQYSTANIFDLNGNKMNLYMGNTPMKQQLIAPVKFGANAVMDDLSAISGTGASANDAALMSLLMASDETMSGTGKLFKRSKEERQANRKKLLDKLKNGGLAVPRTAFLGLVSLNVLKLANRLLKSYSKDQARVQKFWENLGGDWDKLKKAMEKGSKQQVRGTGISGMGSAGAAAAAAIATATPIIAAAIQMFKDLKVSEGANDDAAIDDILEESIDTAANDPKFNGVNAANQVIKQAPDLKDDKGGGGSTPSAGGFTLGAYHFERAYKTEFFLQCVDLIVKSGFYTGLIYSILNF